MKKAYLSLNIYYRVSLISALILIAVSLGLLPLFFLSHPDIPQGIMLGCLVGILSYFILGMINKKEVLNNRSVGAILVLAGRLTVFIGLLVLCAWLTYAKKVYIFNLFALVGGYMIPLIVLLILSLIEHRKGRENV